MIFETDAHLRSLGSAGLLQAVRPLGPSPQYFSALTVFPVVDAAPPLDQVIADQDKHIAEVIARERKRLGSFIRRRVPDPGDAEDILQDVFSELIESVRMVRPIEQVGAWLFQVARNRIIDRF